MNIFLMKKKLFNFFIRPKSDNKEHKNNNEIEDKHEQKNSGFKDNNLQIISNKDSSLSKIDQSHQNYSSSSNPSQNTYFLSGYKSNYKSEYDSSYGSGGY